jgi:hypothetical protein
MTTSPRTLAPPPDRRARPNILVLVAFVLAGATTGIGIGYVIGRAAKASAHPLHMGLAEVALVPVLGFAAIFIHELGHAVIGSMVGMRFILLTTGPLRIALEDGRLRLRLNSHLGLWGGLTLLVPKDPRQMRAQLLPMIAGGPAANLILALACAAAYLLWPLPRHLAIAELGMISGALCLVTLFPNRTGGYASDGAQLLTFQKDPEDAEMRIALSTIAGLSMSGTRPRDYDRGLIDRALASARTPQQRLGGLYVAAMNALDRGVDATRFLEPMGELFQEMPVGLRQSIALWLAYHHAIIRDDVGVSERWLAAGKGGLVDPDVRDLAEAAVAFSRGEGEASREHIRKGLARRPGLDPGVWQLTRDLLHDLEQRVAMHRHS